MYISFNNVNIEGFQAIETASLELDNQGIVKVFGINNYEDNADSNGSGKSSCFEAIMWALFGKTSVGISDPMNRYYDNGCMVELNFEIDKSEYKIIRSVKHHKYNTGVKFFANGNEISYRNKTDTDKAIKEILPFDSDVFLSIVFLSQGFNSRLSALTPSGRKERIESLTGIVDKVEEFKNHISTIKSKLNNEVNDANNKIFHNNGEKSTIQNQISGLEYKISNVGESTLSKDEFIAIKQKLSENELKLQELNFKRRELESLVSEKEKMLFEKTSIKNQAEKCILNLHEQLNKLEKHTCPTCNAVLNEDKFNELNKQYTSDILNEKSKYNQILAEMPQIDNEIINSKKHLETTKSDISAITDENNGISAQIKLYMDNNVVNEWKEQIIDLKSKLYDVEKEYNITKKIYDKLTARYDIANNCLTLVTKQFRTHLLENIINYLNSRLKMYSRMLFSNGEDKISFSVSSNKLDICMGNAQYESLSGGEKRKVDIALTFAQRDLLLDIAGVSTNIIILDEVMDFMDESATNCVLNMIMSVSETISSMFIISHNNYDIPFDKIVKVIKNERRCSTVEVG